MAETTKFSGFPRAAPGFLARLAENNAKPWFDSHRGEYEELLLAPARAAVAALGARLKTHAPPICITERRCGGQDGTAVNTLQTPPVQA